MLDGCVTWPAEFALRYRKQGDWGDATLFDVLARAANAHPDKIAVVDRGCRRSYSELLRNVEALAAGLYSIGLRPLDRVVFQLANGAALVETFFALARIGAIPVLALPAHRKSEVAHSPAPAAPSRGWFLTSCAASTIATWRAKWRQSVQAALASKFGGT